MNERQLAAAVDFPECDKDTSDWSPSDVAACNAVIPSGMAYRQMLTNDFVRACSSASCMRLAQKMKERNPKECLVVKLDAGGGIWIIINLYDSLLTPLDTTCSQINAPKVTDPQTTVATTPAPAPSSTTTASAKTTTPPRSSSAIPSSTQNPAATATPSSSGRGSGSGSGSGSDPNDESSTPAATQQVSTTANSSTEFVPPAALTSSSANSESVDGSIESTATTSPDLAQQVSASSTASSAGVITATVVGVIFLLIFGAFVFIRRRNQNSEPRIKIEEESNTNTTTESFRSADPARHHELTALLRPLLKWRITARELVGQKLLRSGSHGAVYLVTLDGGRRLASKRPIADSLTSQRLKSSVAEVQLAATLNHPSIVSFVGVSWTKVADFQVLYEYMPNGDLRTHLDKTKSLQPEPWTRHKMEMALQIAEGLVYVHSFSPPIVHRDLKARNILLDAKMNAKISDFGVSRSQSEQGTMTTGVGTSRWLAPEVITGGGKYTEQCDIYSFGVVLTEIDTHELPFADEKLPEIELLHRVATGTLRSHTSLQCDPAIKELIHECLSVDPSDRPNALELTYRLRNILKA